VRQLSAELERLKQESSTQRNRWEEEQKQQASILLDRETELKNRLAELEGENRQLQQAQRTVPLTQTDTVEIRPRKSVPEEGITENISSTLPSAFAELQDNRQTKSFPDENAAFARLRALSLLKEDNAQEQESETANNAEDSAELKSEPFHIDPPVPEAQRQDAENDESVDDYINEFLQRMRGLSGDGPSPVTHRPTTVERTAPIPSTPAVFQKTSPSLAAQDSPTAIPAKFEPRSAAPEKSRDLAAMREIANLSARAAIATHHHRRGANRAWGTLATGIVSLITGVTLLIYAPSFTSLLFFIGLSGLGVSTYCFTKSHLLANKLRLLRQHKDLQLATIAHEQIASKAVELNSADSPSTSVTPPQS
jgi:hypothetical protein